MYNILTLIHDCVASVVVHVKVRNIVPLVFLCCTGLLSQGYEKPKPGMLKHFKPRVSIRYGCNFYENHNQTNNYEYRITEFSIELSPDPFSLSKGPHILLGTINETLMNKHPDMMESPDSPEERNRINYFRLLVRNNRARYGYKLGFDFICGASWAMPFFPIPHAAFMYGNMRKCYFSIAAGDVIDFMPYSIGFHGKYSDLEMHCKGCVLKGCSILNISIKYLFYEHIGIKVQYITEHEEYEHYMRIGLVYK